MRFRELILPGRNEYGFADPTAQAARFWVVIVTFDELVNLISDRTGENPRSVGHLIRAWIRDGLLPKPDIVPVPGRRGTRGDYGQEFVIGFFAIRKLRPKGKPLSFVQAIPDVSVIRKQWRWFGRYLDWVRETTGVDRLSELRQMEQEGALPPPPVEIMRQMPMEAPATDRIIRLRLNTRELSRLIPVARGEAHPHFLSMAPTDFAEALGAEDPAMGLLYVRAIEAIWAAVAEVESGHPPDRLAPDEEGDIVAEKDGKVIWRLSTSQWKAAS